MRENPKFPHNLRGMRAFLCYAELGKKVRQDKGRNKTRNTAPSRTTVSYQRIHDQVKFQLRSSFNMPMLYKQGAQKVKPALLAPPNVFLEDAFERLHPKIIR